MGEEWYPAALSTSETRRGRATKSPQVTDASPKVWWGQGAWRRKGSGRSWDSFQTLRSPSLPSATTVISGLNSKRNCRHCPHGGTGESPGPEMAMASIRGAPEETAATAATRSAQMPTGEDAFSTFAPRNTLPPPARTAAPTGNPLYGAYAFARAALASETSASRSASPGPSFTGLLGLLWFLPGDQDLRDPPPLHLLGSEREVVEVHRFPLGGHRPQQPVHQARHRVPFIMGKLHVQEFVHVVDGQAAVYAVRPVVHRFELRLLTVVLVDDLPH